MFREGFSDPVIFAVVGADEDDEVLAGGIIGVEEVGDEAEEGESAGENQERVRGAEGVESFLLEFKGKGKSDRGVGGGCGGAGVVGAGLGHSGSWRVGWCSLGWSLELDFRFNV